MALLPSSAGLSSSFRIKTRGQPALLTAVPSLVTAWTQRMREADVKSKCCRGLLHAKGSHVPSAPGKRLAPPTHITREEAEARSSNRTRSGPRLGLEPREAGSRAPGLRNPEREVTWDRVTVQRRQCSSGRESSWRNHSRVGRSWTEFSPMLSPPPLTRVYYLPGRGGWEGMDGEVPTCVHE